MNEEWEGGGAGRWMATLRSLAPRAAPVRSLPIVGRSARAPCPAGLSPCLGAAGTGMAGLQGSWIPSTAVEAFV